jgi:outer membrane protein TolC
MKKNLVLLYLAFCCAAALPARAQVSPRRISLEEAINLALRQNSLLKIAGHKVDENQRRSLAVRSDYFPQLSTVANYSNLFEKQSLDIPRGSLGSLDGVLLPLEDVRVLQGRNNFFLSTTTVGQPITQLIKIRQAHRIAEADTRSAESRLKEAENEVIVKVHEAYFGLLILQRQRRSAELAVAAVEEEARDSREAVQSGKALEVADMKARASLLDARHSLLTLDSQISDLAIDFNDLLGLPLETEVEVAAPPPYAPVAFSLDESEKMALEGNPEIRVAEQTVEKAQRAVKAAIAEYIPDVTAYGQHIYQNGVPFLSRNNGVLGVKMEWEVFDFGKRRQTVAERKAALAAAEENLQHLRNQVRIRVQKAYRKIDRSRQMIEVAEEAAALRRESLRLSNDQLDTGVIVKAVYQKTGAELAKSEAELLQAELGYRLAKAEFDQAMGLVAH